MRRLWPAVALGVLLTLPGSASAYSTGISGYSGKTSSATCKSCHTYVWPLTLQASLSGPSFLKPGATGSYTFKITGSSLFVDVGGLDVSASGGTMVVSSADPTTQVLLGDLTHKSPKTASSAGTVSWQLDWKAPTTNGTYTLYAAGLGGDGNGAKTYDYTGTTTLSITVGTCQASTDCNDSNPCTTDVCDTTHSCIYYTVAGCCQSATDCDDADACTTDTCTSANKCNHAKVSGCCTTDAQCADSDVCTKDVCDLTKNACSHPKITNCCTTSLACNDGNKCTTDYCVPATNQCTNIPLSGCCLSDADCKDSSTCTKDTCDTTTGTCSNSKISGCCLSDADCDDSNVCTVDACSATTSTCSNTAISGCCTKASDCDDSNPCTVDACTTSVCSSTPIPNCAIDSGGAPYKEAGASLDGGAVGDGSVAKKDGAPASGDTGGSSDAAMGDGDLGPGVDSGGGGAGPGGGCCRVSSARTAETSTPVLGGLGVLLALGLLRRRR
jgi:hypothetical protein